MHTPRVFILLVCVICFSLFTACEKEPLHIKPVNKEFLLSKIFKEGKLYQEYIYNDNKKLIRVNYFYEDSVYHFEAYKYNDEGKAVMIEYSDDYYETYEYDESGKYIKLNLHDNEGEISKVTEFTYNSEGQIEMGVINFRDAETWNITYSYDSRGNVISRIEGPAEGSFFALSSSEFEYDDKNNPRHNWNLPTDIIQYNNPVRYINENMISCAMPPNFEYQYEYNSAGYPVKEIRSWVFSEIRDTFYYEYLKQ